MSFISAVTQRAKFGPISCSVMLLKCRAGLAGAAGWGARSSVTPTRGDGDLSAPRAGCNEHLSNSSATSQGSFNSSLA